MILAKARKICSHWKELRYLFSGKKKCSWQSMNSERDVPFISADFLTALKTAVCSTAQSYGVPMMKKISIIGLVRIIMLRFMLT